MAQCTQEQHLLVLGRLPRRSLTPTYHLAAIGAHQTSLSSNIHGYSRNRSRSSSRSSRSSRSSNGDGARNGGS